MSGRDEGSGVSSDTTAEPSRPSRRRVLLAGVAGVLAASGGVAAATGALDRLGSGSGASASQGAERLVRPARRRWAREQIGSSVEGRPIHLDSNVDPRPRATVLVVAAIHGDERGVGPIGDELTIVTVPDGVSAYVVPIANPDGWARGTRNNARDVDLNRNFPWWWFHGDGGPSRASEPETRTLMSVVERLRPTVTVWVHQPLEYVTAIDRRAEPWAQAWADAAGLPLEPFVSQHGGGESWTFYGMGLASILVEGTTREASVGETSAHRRGFEALLSAL